MSLWRDPTRTFTPNGRPQKRPIKLLRSFSNYSDCDTTLDDLILLKKPTKRPSSIGLRECIESRPPLSCDLVGPTPCTYTTSTVTYSRGIRINPSPKYSRDVLPQPNNQPWTLNVTKGYKSPTPCTYSAQSNGRKAPAYSMRHKHQWSTRVCPGPGAYNNDTDCTHKHYPAHTIATVHSDNRQTSTPGPAHYHPNHTHNKQSSPAYTIRQRTYTV